MEDHIFHQEESPSSPHVVIFPLPIQGPINCMLKLAHLILYSSQSTISVTFLTTDFIRRRLDLNSTFRSVTTTNYGPHIRFETVPDLVGPDEDPRGSRHVAELTRFMEDQAKAEGSRLREVLAYGSTEAELKKPVTCIIADGLYGCMADVAQELRLPLVYMETISPCGLWTYICLPNMLQAGELPFQGKEDLDAAITSVPGMETYLRRCDLPSFCRAYDPNNPVIKLILNEAKNFPRAQGHIFNTFDKLEGDYFPHIQASCPNLYNIGPLHLNLKCRMIQHKATNSYSNSLWLEDRSCLEWLDAQPPKSVLFVSIGSIAVMTWDQLMEFWYGLVNSKTRFLWVRRPCLIIGLSDEEVESRALGVAEEVLVGTKERGCIVSWAPQEEVLAHEAIGGFLTHSGWNSTLESIVEGVPMICWPCLADQQANSRLVSKVWKNGLDMKDSCNRVVVEEMIKELMETKRDELLVRANEMAKLAAEAVAKGGSSYNDLNRLLNDIKLMKFQTPCSE
ncbi:7-deoxyloganetic acid glucosyltransferase [Bienertia sinuspersici]